MMNRTKEVKRPYNSSRRQDQARATRRAIVDAAGRLFVRNGYVATSVDEVAAEAGVSRATVFGAGGKPELLKLAYDFAVGGDDEPIRLVERPRSREIRAEPDAGRYLSGYAGLMTEVYGRLAGIHEAVRGAAQADPDVAALWKAINLGRRRGADTIVADVRKRERLRDGLKPEAAADVVWLMNDPGHYHMLVHGRGWTTKQFEAWLSGSLQRELLSPKPGTR
jgi:AcrR family transcriptional regulator